MAQALALARPARVRHFPLLSTVAGRTPEERQPVLLRLASIAIADPANYSGQSVEHWFTPDFRRRHPEVVAARKRDAAEIDRAAYAAAYHVLAHTDCGDALRRIAAPTLVMTGDSDVGSNLRMARIMAKTIPQTKLGIPPGLAVRFCSRPGGCGDGALQLLPERRDRS